MVVALIQSLLSRLLGTTRPPRTERPKRQVGAIPFVRSGDDVSFLLVSSRRTGRWKFPKGSLMKGRTPAEAAAQEAFEEAGVRGLIASDSVGAYSDQRIRGERRRIIEVELYPLEVTEELADWPECALRRRQWATLAELRALVDDARVVELAEAAHARVLADGGPARATDAAPPA